MPDWEYDLGNQQLIQFFFDLRIEVGVHLSQLLLKWFFLRLHGNNVLYYFGVICIEILIGLGKDVFVFLE
jgi:hypothetical protein